VLRTSPIRPVYPILLDSIIVIILANNEHYVVPPSLLLLPIPNIPLSTLFSNVLTLCSLLRKETKFHTHTRGSVVGWGRSRVHYPMRSLDIFSWPNPSSSTMALRSTQPLTEMSTRNLPLGIGRPARKADNLTAICEPIVKKMWEPRRVTTLWVSTACYSDSFAFFTFLHMEKCLKLEFYLF
jgi:hypothetical protein